MSINTRRWNLLLLTSWFFVILIAANRLESASTEFVGDVKEIIFATEK